MRANFRVRNCDNDPETLEEFLKEIDPDEAYGNILQEETEELTFKPRTFNAHNNNITKLYEAIELEELMNITNDVENMTEKDPIWSHCRPRPNRISHKQYTDGKKENDFLYHANHLSKDSKKLNQAIRKDLSHTTETSKKQITKELDNSSFVKNSKIKQHNKEGEIDELIKTDHSLDELVWKSRMREMPLHDQPEHNLTFMRTDGKLDFLYANQVLKKDIISTNKLQLNQSQKLDHGTNAKNQLRKTFTFEQIINNETTGVKLWDNDTAATFRESDGITSNQTSFNRTSTTETIINPQQAREESIDYDDYADDINSGGGDDSNYRNQHSANFGDFSNREWCPEEDPIQILRTANSQSKYYYIAAEELVWDYAAKQTTEASKH
eukprot:g48134.t1